MYGASQRKVGEHSNRVRPEVGMEFFNGDPESQCCLLETSIPGFCLI